MPTRIRQEQIILDVSAKTSTHTITRNDFAISCDATSAGFSVLLPAEPYANETHRISKRDASANVVTVDGNGKNINGTATQILSLRYDSITVQYNGTEWEII